MWPLSSNARAARAQSAWRWAHTELAEIETLISAHGKMRQQRVPVLVLSYAQLLWDSAGAPTASRGPAGPFN